MRLSKFADYSLVLLYYFVDEAANASRRNTDAWTARHLSDVSGMPQPTVAKILKILTREGLLCSQRGAQGGYSLARPASQISLTEVISAVDGPLALTECTSPEKAEQCMLAAECPVRLPWQRVNALIYQNLAKLSLHDIYDNQWQDSKLTLSQDQTSTPETLANRGAKHD
jgi:FeS assembly SUF system regulator